MEGSKLMVAFISYRQPYKYDKNFPTNKDLKGFVALMGKWPYCERKCTYCNFNKYVNSETDHRQMISCVVQETKTLLQLSGVSSIKSVFFGGGTPSLAPVRLVPAVLDAINTQAHLSADAEVSIEVNPTPTERCKLSDFKAAGVTRVSIGIQSLNDEDLRFFNRNHSVKEGYQCVEEARRLFPGHTSCDVMFGRPGQTLQNWKQELRELVAVADCHLSLYQLTLERGTPLFKQVLDRHVSMPGHELMADLYEAAVKDLAELGFYRYEVSNFAKSVGAESQHNKSYWNGTPYIGVGPGAHGRFEPVSSGRGEDPWIREARVQTLEPRAWMSQVQRSGHSTVKATPLNHMQVLEELLMTALRTTPGLSEQRWGEFSGPGTLQTLFGDTYMGGLLQREGFLHIDSKCMRLCSKGLGVCDSVTSELLTILHQQYELSESMQ